MGSSLFQQGLQVSGSHSENADRGQRLARIPGAAMLTTINHCGSAPDVQNCYCTMQAETKTQDTAVTVLPTLDLCRQQYSGAKPWRTGGQ